MSHRTATRLSERNKTKEDLAKRKAEEELLPHNSKKQMLHRNQEGRKEFEKKLLKDKANPFETHPRGKPLTVATPKAKDIPTAKSVLKIDHEPSIPKRKKTDENIDTKKKKLQSIETQDIENFGTTKKKVLQSIEMDDDDEIDFIAFQPTVKKAVATKSYPKKRLREIQSYDSSSEEEFYENNFAMKERKKPNFGFMNIASNPVPPTFSQPISSINPQMFFSQPVPQKIIPNEVPILIRSSNQSTIELLHAVQLIFHDRVEEHPHTIEIVPPSSRANSEPIMLEFL